MVHYEIKHITEEIHFHILIKCQYIVTVAFFVPDGYLHTIILLEYAY